ncbi:MAG: DNA mismatch repair protein MutS [Weeksellaceae bacterium]|nr:DNA mismatch repair protein MutS [Weeksellaceae bacterium]
MKIPAKSLEDLELDLVLAQIAEYAKTACVEKTVRQLRPLENYGQMMFRLRATEEYLTSLQQAFRIPFAEYRDLVEELKRLGVENLQLPAEFFLSVKSMLLQVKELKEFFDRFEEQYPVLRKMNARYSYDAAIVKRIDQVFDKHGEVKNGASEALSEIRGRLKVLQRRVGERFVAALKANNEYLDEIRESLVDGKRVLAVSSAFRRKVAGRFVGSSRQGSIAYIEPESVLAVQRELDELLDEEKFEINRILRQLTADIALHEQDLLGYQAYLFQLDLIAAQAQYALEIKASVPRINNEGELHLIDAVHPLLYLENKKKSLPTHAHTIELNEDQRIIVISGPNAGGKSISLKTVGLLQLMLQSGIPIPVDERSNCCLFDKIFTDIGDNQSIENQLSTYSYRLKQMRYFLKEADDSTLLLIDEFGTGSDPELGGALAEVFLEEFYKMGAYGVLTTHYTNIKVMIEGMESAVNASMLFDEKTLEPLYKLEVGQAGSSFTFEVAQKNNIPFRLINRAKKKIERNKVRLDKTILKLQQEKFEVQKTRNQLQELKEKSQEKTDRLDETHDRVQSKLVDFQRLYEREQKFLQLGKKVDELADRFLRKNNRKELIANFLKLIATENSKKSTENVQQKRHEKILQRKVQNELKKKSQKIEKIIKKEEVESKEKVQARIDSYKPGDRMRIKGSKSVGTIEKIEKPWVFINYGNFITKINIFDVEKI